ncbi:unnamed protein product [Timema podura]|uniref:DNA polymerase II subunit 2 n=1 Tax=Timema podura TaxID=61482 RepID=A0ABN7P467_TIMPD|nr:unnamed protein product [Timema podura]
MTFNSMLAVMTSHHKMAVMLTPVMAYDAPNEKIHARPAGDLREGRVSTPLQFTKTILCQAHLAPLPLAVCPIYWAHDTAMQLYPLPDLVVVADQFNAFTASYMDCIVTNPVRKGSFPKSDFSFKVYVPSSRQVEDSQLPTD